MNIACVICRYLLTPSDEIFHTPCGHVFHFMCLLQCLERFKRCPQCRTKTRAKDIRKLYVHFENDDSTDSITEKKSQDQDDLFLTIITQDIELKDYVIKIAMLEESIAELVKKIKDIENAHEEKVNFFSLALKEKDKELDSLRRDLQTYKNAQELLDGSETEVEQMILRLQDQKSFITYVTAMRRELNVTMDQKREYKAILSTLQQELSQANTKLDFLSYQQSIRKKLEERIMHYGINMTSLANQSCALEECGPPEEIPNSINSTSVTASNSRTIIHATCVKPIMDRDNSPCLLMESPCNLGKRVLKQGTGHSSSILTKKPRIE